MSQAHSDARRSRRRFATVLALVALVVAVAVLAAVGGAFAVSRCGGGGEARTGDVALQFVADP
jgi:hypothetical protein